ncbi:MAG: pentapeptide repeat-containing protein [Coleofasciculus sp. Co-bin14]|nr:pentapeptide repeat-containing protein [Coleofasciculus sp. Co-bin14]
MNSADDKQRLVEKLLSGVETWNQWRAEHPTQDQERLDLTGVNLCGANLSGVDLSEADLSESSLSGADLSQAKLYAACLSGANLSRANLSFASLNGALFTLADLSGANLGGADLRSLGFLLSDCLYQVRRDEFDAIVLAMRRHDSLQTYLLKANLQSCDLRSARLQGAMFHQANLSETNLSGAEICKTDFQEADLSGADLRGAYITYINLRHSVITRQTQINDRWRRISLLQSNKGTKPYHWEGAQLKYADLDAVDLSGALLPYADLRGTHLRYANLMGTNLDKARTEDTDFEGAKYSCDTILPPLSRLQRQSLVWVESPPEPVNKEVIVDLESLKDERQRTNVVRVRRKDQQKFRDMLIDAFQGKCPITSCDVEGALDAAHIFPYRGPKTDGLWNGILLRLDLHRLFDSYLLTIDPVSGQVYFSNSLMNSYVEYANTTVCFPQQDSLNRQQALRWHNAQCSWLA